MRLTKWTCVLIGLLLPLCGCVGVANRESATPAPANLSYAIPSATYPVGTTITANTPISSGGTVVSYSVVPTLPWGLSLNSTSGVISGLPTVTTPQASYTVTAYNAGGSTSVTLSITVTNEAPASLMYSSNPAIYTANAPIVVNVPATSGGEPTLYAVNPALPPRLTLNTTSGMISGTPSASSPATSYMVTASNAFGSTTVALTISVNEQAATLTYSPSTVVYTVERTITPLTLSNAVTGIYSVDPPLPAGLRLDSNSGAISGTPTSVTSTETYTVTASNSAGNAVGRVSISVDAAPPWTQTIPNMHQTITPLAPAGSQYQQLNPDLPDNPAWLATHAATTAVSPDGGTMLVLTSGYNRVFDQGSNSLTSFSPADSEEYVFVYDISSGAPIKKQVLPVPVTYFGVAWDPTSTNTNPVGSNTSAHFYVSGCSMDDVHVFSYNTSAGLWEEENTVPTSKGPVPALALGHTTGVGLNVAPPVGAVPVNSQVFVYPCAAGIAISKTGKSMVVANYYNDSISVFTGGYGNWQPMDVATGQPAASNGTPPVSNLDLRPGKSLVSAASGTPGGEYPFWVVIQDTVANDTNDVHAVAYVSSIRDREIDVVPLSANNPKQPQLQVTARIAVKGQPNKMVLNQAQTLLYVAEDQSDTVDVIDVNPDPTHYMTVNTIIETIPVLAPQGALPSSFYYSGSNSDIANPIYTGANTNSLTLSPDEKYLYVTNGNLNDVAVVQLNGTNSGDHVIGLIPTGWYPNSVSVNATGTWMYVANAKSPTGANPDWCYGYGPTLFEPNCFPNNQYNPQQTKAGLQSFPIPTASQLP